MNNVFQLPKLKKVEDHSSDDPNANVTIAIAHILASCTQLGHTVKELSKRFGAVDHVIDGLGDAESQNRLKQVMKLSSEALATAMLELSLAIRKLPRLQIDAMGGSCKGTVTAAMVSEARCIACNVKRIVKGVTPVARGCVMQSLECPQCSDLFEIVVRRKRSHASYRATFVDSGDVRDNRN